MVSLRARLDRIARTDFTVLIEGESGVGKELAARHIHASSPRSRGPFIAVNCAAIVETLVETELFGIEERTATGVRGRRGKFELAEDGTLFLDEIGDLSLAAQAKLLRVLQDLRVERVGAHVSQRVNTRIVAATNRPLAAMVQRNIFRPDLYYRLSGVEVHIPPLRARRDDVPLLAAHALRRHRRASCDWTLHESAVEALVAYDWPGNVRQLERVMERAVALSASPEIGVEDLSPEITQEYRDLTGGERAADYSLAAWTRRYARLVLDRCHCNKREACERLDICYHTLQQYLKPPGAPDLPGASDEMVVEARQEP
jgi:transcriptional regulator with PAS, ATPase and Fis domain